MLHASEKRFRLYNLNQLPPAGSVAGVGNMVPEREKRSKRELKARTGKPTRAQRESP